MEGTNIHTTKEENIDRNGDRTYYGNGCPNGWDTRLDYSGGSPVACSSRVNETYDGEILSIGTYYTFGAATSGSGRTVITDNANAPDSFCPLGWQLPYGGTGGDYYNQSKSWEDLLGTYSIPNTAAGSRAARSYPFSFVLGGRMFLWDVGALFVLGTAGHYWSSAAQAANEAYKMTVWIEAQAQPNMIYSKDNPMDVRCNRQLHRRHGGKH